MNEPYFVGASGKRYYFAELEQEIRRDYPHLVGAHIFEQLRELSLAHEFGFGCTPCELPLTFAEKDVCATSPSPEDVRSARALLAKAGGGK